MNWKGLSSKITIKGSITQATSIISKILLENKTFRTCSQKINKLKIIPPYRILKIMKIMKIKIFVKKFRKTI